MKDCFITRHRKMRVKTAPKQRITPNSDNDNCNNDSLNGNQSNGLINIEERKEETLKYCQEVLDMSMKHKDEITEDSLTTCFAGPSSCEYLSSPLEEENNSNCDNNNTIMPDADTVNSSELTTCSCMEPEYIYKYSPLIEEKSTEALNLCKRDEDALNTNVGCDARLKDTFLYKIMTDPTFLENIQKHKQTKKHVCQFCKQEFINGDQLADHMVVKKDESNQVICCACNKTFAQKRYLRYHQRCHSERAVYTCDICTKKYTRLDNLTRHNVFHVNPEKFSCAYCEKTFSRKDLLNKHLKCHDNKYTIYCELCHKYFKDDGMMEKHKKMFHAIL